MTSSKKHASASSTSSTPSTSDERWERALAAKGINVTRVGARRRNGQGVEHALRGGMNARQGLGVTASHAKPFKATGHKGGISRLGK